MTSYGVEGPRGREGPAGPAGPTGPAGPAGSDWAAQANLSALAALNGVANRLPYFTGAGALSLATFTAAARTLLDDADVAAMRATLGGTLGSVLTRVNDTHANRLAAAHVAGRDWRESDTGLIYADDGAAWTIAKGDGAQVKTADQDLSNTVAMTDIGDLALPVEPNETWFVEVVAMLQGSSANADWKLGWTFTAAGMTAQWGFPSSSSGANAAGSFAHPAVTATPAAGLALGATQAAGGLAGTQSIQFQGWFFNGANSGVLKPQAAQTTQLVEASKVLARSFMRYRRLV
jgi:hypothetical protein